MIAKCWMCAVVFAATAALSVAADEKYALVVGVEKYIPTELPSLEYAEDDVVAIGRALEVLGFSVITMTTVSDNPRQRSTTAARIMAGVESRLEDRNPTDTIVLAFSGHGLQFKGDREFYFCPGEAELRDRSTLVPMSRVLAAVGMCRAGRKLLLVDACRNELTPESAAKGGGVIELEPAVGYRPAPPVGTIALFSCQPREKSYELKQYGHSLFTHHVVEYLTGKAAADRYPRREVSVEELVPFVRNRTRESAAKLLGASQKPEAIAPEAKIPDWSLGSLDCLAPGEPAARHSTANPSAVMNATSLRDQAIAADAGLGRKVDHVEANRLFHDAAEAGDPVACVYLGNAYAIGRGDIQPGQWKESDHWFRKSVVGVQRLAELGEPAGMVAHSRLLMRGRECARDENAALEMLKKAALVGFAPGVSEYASAMLERGPNAAEKQTIVAMLEQASAAGSPEADVILGDMHQAGDGVAKDVQQAMACYERAIRLRFDKAYGRLAALLWRGEAGVPKNERRALELYLEAYRISPYCGCSHAISIAHCYLSARDEPKYTAKARAFLDLAAAGGPYAQRSAGLLLLDGKNFAADEARATDLFRRSLEGFRAEAERGNDDANLMVSWHYLHGAGVEKDSDTARRWLGKAVVSSRPSVASAAQQALDSLDKASGR